jgi:predicted nucleic acid-binding protein
VTFVDTGFLLALAHRRDGLHPRAMAWIGALEGRGLLITEYVLVEAINALSKLGSRPKASVIAKHVVGNSRYLFIPASPRLLESGLLLHRSRPDKEWSLTDCISFQVMTERGIRQALAHDEHFEQAGFEALLRCDP